MTKGSYSQERLERILVKLILPTSYRIFPASYLTRPLGLTQGDSRFCSKNEGRPVLYVSPTFATAFVETVVRDRLVGKEEREIGFRDIVQTSWAQIGTIPTEILTLMDLRNAGCFLLGAPTDTVHARNHSAGRALGRIIWSQHKNVDGFLFPSRLTGGDVYAIFERAVAKLNTVNTGMILENPELTDVLSKYRIKLTDHYTQETQESPQR